VFSNFTEVKRRFSCRFSERSPAQLASHPQMGVDGTGREHLVTFAVSVVARLDRSFWFQYAKQLSEPGGTVPVKPRGMHKSIYQRILGMIAYHEAVRNQGAGYARKSRPDQHRAHLWRQCRSRFSIFGGWPIRYSVDGQYVNCPECPSEKREMGVNRWTVLKIVALGFILSTALTAATIFIAVAVAQLWN